MNPNMSKVFWPQSLTPQQIDEIRELYPVMTVRALAKKFKASSVTISLIARLFGLSKVNKTSSKKVMQMGADGEPIRVYNSIAEASRAIGLVSNGSIYAACRGKCKTAYGYKWSYVNVKTDIGV